ncbi:MAG TPA: hypothetical protein VNJ52_02595 [Patescibacteria group bacterium]|nr:hypothetical protein [Patescibacteria group bacterium]
MKRIAWTWTAAAILPLALAAGASAQFPPPVQVTVQRSPSAGPPVFHLAPPPGPMGGVFTFVGPLSDVTPHVVKGQPFSAEVVRDTVEQLADGNRIERTSTGTMARDSQGRTRREMTLENIGPWAAAGHAPRLVIIDDPVAGKVYTLDRNKKIAIEMAPPPRLRWVLRNRRGSKAMRSFQNDAKTESLGEKTMDGVRVEGTETVLTIPAGKIGNEKPIVITRKRWYSPDLKTTILLTRTDPRFGTTTYQLKDIRLAEPAQSLFAVPSGYTIRSWRENRVYRVSPGGPAPDSNSDFP